jgi:hypothetical protein
VKTYYLIFKGDPRPHLDEIRSLGAISVVSIGESLHCISVEPSLSESIILKALCRGDSETYLLPAALPIYPQQSKKLTAEIIRLIGEDDRDSGSILGV